MTSLPMLPITLLLVGMITIPGGAQQPSAPPPPATPEITVPAKPAEDVQLFETKKKLIELLQARAQLQAELHATPQAKVVCGTRVIVADPSIDPKIVKPTPPDRGEFKIKRIDPPVCNQPMPGR